MPWVFVAYTNGVSSSLGGKLFFATTSAILFLCFSGPVPPRGKFEICVEFDPGFNPFRNFHDISHTSLPPLISLSGLPNSLGYNHHCDGCSHYHDDNVGGI